MRIQCTGAVCRCKLQLAGRVYRPGGTVCQRQHSSLPPARQPQSVVTMLLKWIEKVRSGEFLAEEELKALCDLVKEVLVEESNVQPVSSPVTVS